MLCGAADKREDDQERAPYDYANYALGMLLQLLNALVPPFATHDAYEGIQKPKLDGNNNFLVELDPQYDEAIVNYYTNYWRKLTSIATLCVEFLTAARGHAAPEHAEEIQPELTNPLRRPRQQQEWHIERYAHLRAGGVRARASGGAPGPSADGRGISGLPPRARGGSSFLVCEESCKQKHERRSEGEAGGAPVGVRKKGRGTGSARSSRFGRATLETLSR